jgi:hypothetical protein
MADLEIPSAVRLWQATIGQHSAIGHRFPERAPALARGKETQRGGAGVRSSTDGIGAERCLPLSLSLSLSLSLPLSLSPSLSLSLSLSLARSLTRVLVCRIKGCT